MLLVSKLYAGGSEKKEPILINFSTTETALIDDIERFKAMGLSADFMTTKN